MTQAIKKLAVVGSGLKKAESYTPYEKAQVFTKHSAHAAEIRAENWRRFTGVSLVINIVAVAGLVYAMTQPRNIPLVFQYDSRTGKVDFVGKITSIKPPKDSRAKNGFVNEFVDLIRSVPKDPVYARKNFTDAKGMLSKEALGKLAALYKKSTNSPFTRLKDKKTVMITMHSVLPVTGKQYFARWEETVFSDKGALEESYLMTGMFTVGEAEELGLENEAQLKNPFGLIITDFKWHKELEQ